MESVDVHECFVWLPAVRLSSPSDQELHGRSSLVITAMRKDLLYHELLFVLLRNVLRINLSRVEVPSHPWLSVLSCPRLDPLPRMSWTQRSLLHRLVPQMGRSY